MGDSEQKSGQDLTANTLQPNDLQKFHRRRIKALWALHDRAVREARDAEDLTPAQLTTALQRCAGVAKQLIDADRLTEQVPDLRDSARDPERLPGVIIVNQKADVDRWEVLAVREIKEARALAGPGSGEAGASQEVHEEGAGREAQAPAAKEDEGG